MDKKLNKVVVITGASAGVGRSIAEILAKRGARLGLIARGEEKLASTLEEVRRLGGEGITCAIDVSRADEVEKAAQKIEQELGPIDIWINNAMVTMIGKIEDIRPEEIRRVIDVNYLGSVYGTKVALRRFLPRNEGMIIQIGSALAYIAIPLQSAYCASKHAIRAFLQSLRIELKMNKSSIILTEIHLPAVNTPQFEWMKNYLPKHPMPVPPIYEPDVIARAVNRAIDKPRREIWVGWPVVKAVLASRFVPRIAEWKLSRSGLEDQQTDLIPPTHQSNLWAPLPIDYGAHGEFTEESKSFSSQQWVSQHRMSMAAGILSLGAFFFWKFQNHPNLQRP